MDHNSHSIGIYNRIADIWVEHYNGVSQEVSHFVESLAKDVLIIDLGCGAGANTHHIFNKGYAVIGIDLSDNLLTHAKEHYPGVLFRRDDARTFTCDPAGAIIIHYCYVSMPKKEIEQSLQQVLTNLQPGGKLFLAHQEGESKEIPDEPFFPEHIGDDSAMFLSIYTKDEMVETLVSAGFVIDDVIVREPKGKEITRGKIYVTAHKA
ncbi:MAG: SAM-dependent methyltransferase [Candidatus Woesearchaeota archaeon]|jgi:SAM-dependent methyltransferase